MMTEVCENCGSEKEEFENIAGVTKLRCPECEGDPRYQTVEIYRCYGCWKPNAHICHHASYDPEIVVPMCSDCHSKLHSNKGFLPHLTPNLTRREAEEMDLVTEIGLKDTDHTPVEVYERKIW